MAILNNRVGKVLAAAVAASVALLVGLEGYPGKPYYDVAGILTDCYGNTKNVSPNRIRSDLECRELLEGEALRIGEFVYADVPAEHRIPKNTLAAVISWTYNVGDGAYRGSTLRQYLRRGDWAAACHQMSRWVYITEPRSGAKVVSKGLQNRRAHEVQVCLDF